jgi:L,D-peptidoglycan transpeptidase YkuD (ErfK/YbiS/YcfS/YnhG family)
MELKITPGGAEWNGRPLRCALGRAGVSAAKREGDGATPLGSWRMRALLFRPDRFPRAPLTKLPIRALRPEDGWCDDPSDLLYNRPVALPYRARAEELWREDGLYDLVVPLGYNDDRPVPGRGSAIFLHVARPDFSPTEGCVALAREDLLAVIAEADTGSSVVIS